MSIVWRQCVRSNGVTYRNAARQAHQPDLTLMRGVPLKFANLP